MSIIFDFMDDAPKCSTVIIDGIKYVPERMCEGCSRLGDNDYCWSCSRHFPDMYKPKEVE